MIAEINEYRETQDRIETDIRRRVAEHQAEIENARGKGEIALGKGKVVGVADGDSWFDYPLPLPPQRATDVRDSLNDGGPKSPILLKLAHHGDATTELLGVRKRRRLIKELSDQSNGPIEVILFSGGGNDLVGDQFLFWLRDADSAKGDPENGVRADVLADILGVVVAGYQELANIREHYAPKALLLFHAYDFAIPTGEGVCSAGPWLLPSLTERGWNKKQGAIIVRAILSEFHNRLSRFASSVPIADVVPTHGTLQVGDWANELHPTPDGFRAIAQKFRETLSLHFPGRIDL